ncbi:MAG TPA: FlgD immunoglobulin-like domain containing protein, partial [Vicinamibacterales bacterium]
SGGNAVNPHGLTESIVTATSDIMLLFDIYAGQLNLPFTGVGYQPCFMVYPIQQTNNGGLAWSDPQVPPFLVFNPDPQCYGDWYNLGGDIGIPNVANAYNVPDSMRVMVSIYQACYRFGVTLGCNDNDGVYFDNVSMAFVDEPEVQASNTGAINPGPVSHAIWQLPTDVFPANETPLLPNSSNFDTTTALIQGNLNIAQASGNQLRFNIQPDSVLITANNVSGSTDPDLGNTTRLDMMFRILPGPGNYAIASPGGRTFPPTATMQLLDLPTNQANLVSSGDGSFWGAYIANPGVFAGGSHNGGTRWDYLTWNSARCDSAEVNAFPVAGKIGQGIAVGQYVNYLHEEDPHFASIGVTQFRCFMVDTAGTPANANILCNGTIPAWLTAVPASRTGWDGLATTKEYTKIIPDGLLTPGSHVQYFYRKSARADSVNAYTLSPDTLTTSGATEGPSADAHRWQQFGVLPDRWKDVAFGGSGMACMLYVDWNDRRGNERVFVSVMDSLGGTAPAKYGAHNGWHAPALVGPITASSLAAYPVYGKNQQPGTSWDMYGVKAAESQASGGVSLGNRLSNRAAMGFAAGKYSRTGPTPEMLRRFYRLLTILTGDLNSGVTGPFFNKSVDDIGILNDFLTGNDPGSTAQPRGIFIGGDGFAQNEDLLAGQNASHGLFLSTKLGLTLRNGSYQAVSNNTNDCADLVTTAVITSNGDVYGVGNSCAFSNDLLQRNPSITEAQEAVYYENVGSNGPYVASVHKPTAAARPWVAYTEGWDIEHLWSRYCLTTTGRLMYYWNVYNAVFATQCQTTTTAPCMTTDVPQSPDGRLFTNFMKVGNSVVRAGSARIHFGVASTDRVRIRMYDVSGRLVRTIADRSFNPGQYDLAWDGADDNGNQAPRGVYFARIEYSAAGGGINGRVVILR